MRAGCPQATGGVPAARPGVHSAVRGDPGRSWEAAAVVSARSFRGQLRAGHVWAALQGTAAATVAATAGVRTRAAMAAPSAARAWPTLIILDLMLPQMGGVDVCKLMRLESIVPILIVTAKDAEQENRP